MTAINENTAESWVRRFLTGGLTKRHRQSTGCTPDAVKRFESGRSFLDQNVEKMARDANGLTDLFRRTFTGKRREDAAQAEQNLPKRPKTGEAASVHIINLINATL